MAEESTRTTYRLGIGEWIGILGIALALLTWWHSYKTRDLSVRIAPTVVEVVKRGAVTDLAVSFRGSPITSDLRVYQVAIWNAGREPIRRDDITKTVTLGWSQNVNVLEVKLLRTTRDESEIVVGAMENQSHKVRLDWKILEENDGALLQLLVQGDQRPQISVTGTIVGQGRVDSIRRAPTGNKEGILGRWETWFVRGLVAFLIWGFSSRLLTRAKIVLLAVRIRPPPWRDVLRHTLMLAVKLLAISILIWTLYILFLPESPFEF